MSAVFFVIVAAHADGGNDFSNTLLRVQAEEPADRSFCKSNIFIQAEILPVDWISYSRSEIVQTQHSVNITPKGGSNYVIRQQNSLSRCIQG